MRLHELAERQAAADPDATAVVGPDATLSYGELSRLSNRIAHALADLGVARGDRVAIWLDKSAKAVAAMQGILKLGAAYVPLDPQSPQSRAATIIDNCRVKLLVTDSARAESIAGAVESPMPLLLSDGAPEYGKGWSDLDDLPDDSIDDPGTSQDDLAYILYTSGSTGVPKGVCISHVNAFAFVEWSVALLRATRQDRFSNHAPFHFDLSVLDIYGAFLSGARVCIVPEAYSYSGRKLVEFLRDQAITIWYSVPTALIMMMENGQLFDEPLERLRVILFAGEVFPIKHLRALHEHLTGVRMLNFYGPTETNVCTYYEVVEILEDRGKPVPIGRASCGDRVWAVRADGSEAGIGEEGELWVEGPTVMLGYWGRDPQGSAPYATGDIVVLLEDGNYDYVGRRDHQVKVRGYRIELGEVEAALLRHERIKEAAVVVAGAGSDARLVAFVVVEGKPLSILALKKQCADWVPSYMIIDKSRSVDGLPRTPNGKIDRLKLTRTAETDP